MTCLICYKWKTLKEVNKFDLDFPACRRTKIHMPLRIIKCLKCDTIVDEIEIYHQYLDNIKIPRKLYPESCIRKIHGKKSRSQN